MRAVHCTHARPAGRRRGYEAEDDNTWELTLTLTLTLTRRGYEAEDDNTWEPAGHLHKDLVRVGTSPPSPPPPPLSQPYPNLGHPSSYDLALPCQQP